MNTPASTEYRADIDGLRAVAVSSVLLFHAFPGWLPGGFVGVDIFFIISGYLISGIIFKGLARSNFSFVEFYSRRIRRIFPALILACAACLLFGWFSLVPIQFEKLGTHLLGAATFTSNLILLNESGYFDTDSALKPLRHLWSLGIEEQYYLVWPLLLFIFRKNRLLTVLLLVAVLVISFALNLHLTATDRAGAYYLPQARFWELMIGSALAYISSEQVAIPESIRRWRQSLNSRLQFTARIATIGSVVGVAAIILSLALVNEREAFPGWWALLPCVGSALLIWAGPATWINRNILASKPFVWIGLISYPLYLWHWPLISFANIMSERPSIAYRVIALAVSIVFARLTYVFVELPIRHGKTSGELRRVTFRLATCMIAVAVVGVVLNHDIIRSVSAGDARVVNISAAPGDWERVDNETVPGTVKNVVLFFGDSHMEQYWPRAEWLTQQSHDRRTVEFFTMGGCAPIPAIERRNKHCLNFVTQGLARAVQPDVDVVVIAARWSGFTEYNDYYRPGTDDSHSLNILSPENAWAFDAFSDALADLRKHGKRVVVLLSSPHGPAYDPKSMIDHHELIPHAKQIHDIDRADIVKKFSSVDDPVRAAAGKAGAEVLDPKDWFCNATTCAVMNSNGAPTSTDGSHVRASIVRERATALDEFVLVKSPG